MKKINYGGSSKILNGIVTKINAIIDSMVVDVKVNDVSVVDENHVANIDLTLADQNVKQSPTTDDADYRILLSKSANDTEETDISRKNTNFKYNPSTGNLQVSKVNGNTVPSGSGTVAMLSDIPDELADLADDVNHRLVTDTEKNTWNNNRAVAEIRLTNEDLDNVTTPGFYFAAGGNTVTNKPSGYGSFGLVVIHNASGSQYTQIISNENGSHRRIKKSNGTWTSWAEDKFTDTIPNDATLSIQLNGESVNSFTANASSNVIADIHAAVNYELMTEDLNDVKTVGFYVGKSGNTCANKPSSDIRQFGLIVIKTATSVNYYKQTLIRPIASGETWSRSCVNGTWSAWTKEITTDENVKQSQIASTNANYPLLLAYSANGTEETNTVWKDTNIAWNPSTNTFKISNGYMEAYRGKFTELLGTFIGFMAQNTLLAYFSPNPNQASGTTVEAVMPATSGTLALQSELPTEAVEWSEMNVLGAKNLITFPYYHGFSRTTNNVVFTVDNDGIITVGGTQASANASFYLMYNVKLPNGTYTLSDGGVGTADTYLSCVYYTTPSASAQYYDVANNGSVTFTVNNWDRATIRIWSRSGKTAANLVFKPMFRLSTISDDTFEPYAETNRQLTLNKLSWEENKASGVKNYFPYPYYIHPLQGETYTQRGIQWTDNGDRGIKANGTNDNTGNSYCQLMPTSLQSGVHFCKLPQGKYHFSGGISSDYYMNLSTGLETSPTDRTVIDYDYGNGFDFEVTEAQARDNIFCAFTFVLKGKTANNVVFYPMITRYEDSSQGYAEYAMTNAELTQFKADMDNIAPTETSGTAVNSYAVGDYMWWRHGFYRVTQAIAVGDSITTSKVTKTTLGAELKRALT